VQGEQLRLWLILDTPVNEPFLSSLDVTCYFTSPLSNGPNVDVGEGSPGELVPATPKEPFMMVSGDVVVTFFIVVTRLTG
jgi:hypothetical protein